MRGTTLVFHGPVFDYCRRCAGQINRAFKGETLRPSELKRGEKFNCEGCDGDFTGVSKKGAGRVLAPVLERKQ